uniref:C-type lectin domain-containing protein n=1 Tax=Sinocyclocheilus anshuiensis TaxID=1608454 RepID=A0A671NZ89_9TELE
MFSQLTSYLSSSGSESVKNGWVYYQSSFYFISSEMKSWAESRRYCTEREADRIITNNREEQVSERYFWIGLTDIDMEGRWKWRSDIIAPLRFGHPKFGSRLAGLCRSHPLTLPLHLLSIYAVLS